MAATLDDLHYVAVALRVDVRSGLDEVVSAIGGIKGGGGTPKKEKEPAGGVSGWLEKVAVRSVQAGTALAVFTATFDRMISGLGENLTKFVRLANPAVVMRFNMALENAMSAMGRILIPVLIRFTTIIQQIGNAIESLSPTAKNFIAALTAGAGLSTVLGAVAVAVSLLLKTFGVLPTIILLVVGAFAGVMATMSEGKQMAGSLREILKAVGSVVEVLAQVFMIVFVPVIKHVALVIKEAADFITDTIRRLASLVGIDLPEYDPNKNKAQAVRQSQMTDLKSFASRAYTSVYGGAGMDTPKAQLDEAKKQTSRMDRIITILENGKSNPEGGRAERGAGRIGGDVGGDTGRGIGKWLGKAADLAVKPFMIVPNAVVGVMRNIFGD